MLLLKSCFGCWKAWTEGALVAGAVERREAFGKVCLLDSCLFSYNQNTQEHRVIAA